MRVAFLPALLLKGLDASQCPSSCFSGSITLMNGLHMSGVMCLVNRQPSCSWPGRGPRITQKTRAVGRRFRRSSRSKESSFYHSSVYCFSSPLTPSLTLSMCCCALLPLPAVSRTAHMMCCLSVLLMNSRTMFHHCVFHLVGIDIQNPIKVVPKV